MTILAVVMLMAFGIFIGKRSTHMGMKEYMIVTLLTLAQLAVFITAFYMMEKPPGF
ncbi:MAG: hypothetical protein ACM3Q4_09500 [Acidobacteriota bacterium]